METMGDGLKKASGSKLEEILSRLTSNVPKGVLLGTAVTAVIQSSSATTVMLVGFVNSGIMSLRQAIPVIMGANIGTTATAWLLSLSGIEGDSFLIQMLKPMSFSPILAAVAIVFMMFMKSEKKYDIGLILIGFAVLMYGMDIMSSCSKAAGGCAGIHQCSDDVQQSGSRCCWQELFLPQRSKVHPLRSVFCRHFVKPERLHMGQPFRLSWDRISEPV